jgi:hypothetical protein
MDSSATHQITKLRKDRMQKGVYRYTYLYKKIHPPPYELMSREGGRQVRKEGREKNLKNEQEKEQRGKIKEN